MYLHTVYTVYMFLVSIANCGIVAGPVGAAAGSPASCHAPGPIYIHGGSMNEYLYIYGWVDNKNRGSPKKHCKKYD